VNPPEPVPFDEVVAFLEERYGTTRGEIELLEGGAWSQAFAFNHAGVPSVLRVGFHRKDYEADRMAMRYAADELPVPEIVELGEAFGRYYVVSRRAYGRFLESLDEAGWRRILPALWRALDRLRSFPGSLVPDGDWRDGLLRSLEDRPGRVSGWEGRLSAMPDINRVFRAGVAELETLLPECPPDRHAIHGDLINRNVLVSDGGTALTAVFDWGCSLGVDFLYEIAGLTFFAGWYPAMQGLDLRRAARQHYAAIGLAVPRYEERLRAYELHIGVTHITYCIFADLDKELRWITDRTEQVLRGETS
jgi:hygromycin-B 4-O-kinase